MTRATERGLFCRRWCGQCVRLCARLCSRWCVAAAVALSVMCGGWSMSAQTSVPSNPQLQEARRAYDATDFETARALLTTLINQWTGSPDETIRPQLAAAYELRGRTLQNLRDIDAARNDWRMMLLLVPGYTFPVEAGPRALALFEEVRATTIGMADIVVSPADAEVRVDGRLIADRPVRPALTDGQHTVTAQRRSFRAAEQTFTIRPGEITTVPLALERTQSTLTFSASPGQVEVFVNNERRGVTQPDASGSPNDAEARPSLPFVIDELPTGRYTLDLRAPCFVSEQRVIDVQRPQDIRLETIRLTPARGEVSVQSNVPDARIVTTGAPAGAELRPPQVLSLCAGPHVVQVLSPLGRDVRRFDLKTGQKEQFSARVRPAFALVAAPDAGAAAAAGRDVRLSAEQAFREASAVMLFAADEGVGTAPAVSAPDRRALVSKVTSALGAQGLATLSPQAGSTDSGAAGTLQLTLWAPGSGKPDVIRWRPADTSSTADVIRRLDVTPSLTRAWLGVLAIDVLDVGVVVASIDAGSGVSGVQAGEVIVSAGGKPVTAAAELLSAAESLAPGASLPIEVRDRAGATRRVDLAVNRIPRVIDPLDQTILPNVLAVSLTGRALSRATPLETASIRLNLAVAWIQAEAWPTAQAELDAVDALLAKAAVPQPVNDAIAGTSAYLRGVSAEKSGDSAGAERAWMRAAQFTGPLLIESGGSIKDMAERRLAALRQPSTP